eukprot:jgi/Botrbrau1/3334/Bobra.0048s0029.1
MEQCRQVVMNVGLSCSPSTTVRFHLATHGHALASQMPCDLTNPVAKLCDDGSLKCNRNSRVL